MDNDTGMNLAAGDEPKAKRPGRPLVTFALFTYNQEKFIREAVEGAFAQTYEPLEIILSDDCSTDRTFEIMQEMAAAYRGPHQVKAVQTPKNLGVAPHVLLRGREAAGDIIVMAAGDDISKPNRVAEHIGEYDDPSVFGVSGAFDLIDESGTLIASEVKTPLGLSNKYKHQSFLARTNHEYVVIQGSTSSYRRQIFSFPLPDWKILFAEDLLSNFLIYAHGARVGFIPKSLISYRVHENAMSNRGKHHISPELFEAQTHFGAKVNLNKMKTFSWIAARSKGAVVDMAAIHESTRQSMEILNWPSYTIAARLRSIIAELVLHRARLLKWKAARLLGDLPTYQPKLFLSRFQRQYR